MLDRNAETMAEIIRINQQLEKNGLAGLPEATERKERLTARLHRRLLKLARWCDTSEAERKRADDEYEQAQIKVRKESSCAYFATRRRERSRKGVAPILPHQRERERARARARRVAARSRTLPPLLLSSLLPPLVSASSPNLNPPAVLSPHPQRRWIWC